jgi:hypothetical protein
MMEEERRHRWEEDLRQRQCWQAQEELWRHQELLQQQHQRGLESVDIAG